jgi:hypothetical protein
VAQSQNTKINNLNLKEKNPQTDPNIQCKIFQMASSKCCKNTIPELNQKGGKKKIILEG